LAVYNSQAIAFMLENYTINKVILSREITLREIEFLVTSFPDTEFEVFGEGDFCRYNNGLCYAEHKYGAKDICTVVVNDLVIKKTYRPDFRKIITSSLSDQEKLEKFDDTYRDMFSQIELIFEKLLIGDISDSQAKEPFEKILLAQAKRIDLFFDAQKPMSDVRNHGILSVLKALKFIEEQGSEKGELQGLKKELEASIKTGMNYLAENIKRKG
jgi:Peptidase family U32